MAVFNFRPAAVVACPAAPFAAFVPLPARDDETAGEGRLGVVGVFVLVLLADELEPGAAAAPVAEGGVGALAGSGCVPWVSTRSAKGGESACWPLVGGRAGGGVSMALTSGAILGVLDTATLPETATRNRLATCGPIVAGGENVMFSNT